MADDNEQRMAKAAEIILEVADRINDACNEGTPIAGSQTVDPLMEAHGILTAECECETSDDGIVDSSICRIHSSDDG